MNKIKDKKPTAIDLFCGAGGLTWGLKKAGFKVIAGIELNKEIAKTYQANHRGTKLLIKDIRNVSAKDLLGRRKSIDLIAGCPPCQGFSQLTEKYKREDPRNDLALEMARIVLEIKPRMVMMENVPGMVTKGKHVLDKLTSTLEKEGYVVNYDVLQMADYGVPQSRRRFVLLAGKGFEIPLPEPTHSRKRDEKKRLKRWTTLVEVIKGMPEPVKLSHALKNGGPERFDWHVVKDLKDISIQRLKAMKEGDSRFVLPHRLRPKCHKSKKAGFRNVYGRLSWNNVSSTITSGCTTLSMGRFGHPEEIRTLSIREAAIIQTFPKAYKFKTSFMDMACDLVGNALPCRFARKAGEACMSAFLQNARGGRI